MRRRRVVMVVRRRARRVRRDRGHFNGPKPQLLTETGTDDLAILLVGADRAQSQIEFGAHQAVLVRSQVGHKHIRTRCMRHRCDRDAAR